MHTKRGPGRPSNEELNTLRVIPLHARHGFVRFLDRAAAKAGVSRAKLVRDGAGALAEKVLGEKAPELEPVGPGVKS